MSETCFYCQCEFHRHHLFSSILPIFAVRHAGRRMENVVMLSSEEQQISPPWSLITFLQMYRPMPVPSFFVVKNGSKIVSTMSAGIDGPLLAISMMMLPSWQRAAMLIRRGFSLSFTASIELSKMFTSTWRS